MDICYSEDQRLTIILTDRDIDPKIELSNDIADLTLHHFTGLNREPIRKAENIIYMGKLGFMVFKSRYAISTFGNFKTKITHDDLVALLLRQTPNFTVFDRLMLSKAGTYTPEGWVWDVENVSALHDNELLRLYNYCKNSWK